LMMGAGNPRAARAACSSAAERHAGKAAPAAPATASLKQLRLFIKVSLRGRLDATDALCHHTKARPSPDCYTTEEPR